MLGVDQPVDPRVRHRGTQRRCGRQGVHDVAERARVERSGCSSADAREHVAGRVILRITDDGDAAAVGAHGIALGDGLDRVVGALAVHVRAAAARAASSPSARRRWSRSRRRGAPPRAPRDPRPSERAGPAPSFPPSRRRSPRRSGGPPRRQPPGDSGVSDVQQVEAAVCEGERQARSAVGAHAIDEIRACEDMSHCVDWMTPPDPCPPGQLSPTTGAHGLAQLVG